MPIYAVIRARRIADEVLAPHGPPDMAIRTCDPIFWPHNPMRGFGSFESASRFSAAFEEMQQYLRVRRRGEPHVSLAEQRRLFLTRWRSLTSEIVAA